jgi:N-acetylmuramoyl-L-alanine amidase
VSARHLLLASLLTLLAGGALAQSAGVEVRAASNRRTRIIGIDAGHGGVDYGMTGPIRGTKFLKEKDVTLAIARYLAAELHVRGFGTFLTRDRDTLIARDDRGGIARRAGADVFVSIHVNAANPRWRNAEGARGFETYFLAEARTEDERRVARMENSSVRFETDARARRGDPLSFIIADMAANEHLRESSQMAQLVQQQIEGVHPAVSRGVKQAPFAVLSTSYMPAILIETGFGSNAAEARYLVSPAGQQRIARAVAEGLVRYFAEYERRVAAGQ